MKSIFFAMLLVILAVFLATTFVSSPAAQTEAAKYFSQKQIADGIQFSFERRLFFWAGFGLHLAILSCIVFSGFARKLADAILGWSSGRWLLTVLLVGGFCFLADEAVSLPLGIARLENVRAWGLTHRSITSWLVDHFLAAGISAIIGGIALAGLYFFIRFFPRTWWAPASLGVMVLAMFVAFILPVWIAPLFNTFTPLEQTPWADLKKPIEDLARRADVPVSDVLVADASRQGSYTNAYFSGFGPTRRIVLYDTLLKAHGRLSPATTAGFIGLAGSASAMGPVQGASLLEAGRRLGRCELESILAHEMGHWLHNHIVKGIVMGTLAACVGFFILCRILLRLSGSEGHGDSHALRRTSGRATPVLLKEPADPAGVPLVLLLSALGLWLASPLEYAVSRHFERQADMVSLDLTHRPQVFIEAEKRLARDNIGNVAPSPISVWFFNTHPPPVERIRMAEEWTERK